MLDRIARVRKFLEGKKSYILGALAGVAVVAHNMGWIDDQALKTVLELAGVGYSFSMAAKVNRAISGGEKQTEVKNHGQNHRTGKARLGPGGSRDQVAVREASNIDIQGHQQH
jgi:hypothetical protein